MILLDTNVVSEWMKPSPDPQVIVWLDVQLGHRLFLPAIVVAEIEAGISGLPNGKRRRALQLAANAIFDEFQARCLPLDCAAAVEYGVVKALSKRAGRPMTVEDAQIAAIARLHNMKLATRNGTDFSFLDAPELIDPWNREHENKN